MFNAVADQFKIADSTVVTQDSGKSKQVFVSDHRSQSVLDLGILVQSKVVFTDVIAVEQNKAKLIGILVN